ncbi:hypothetical protein bcgnr5378_06860 [Bacillus cereus]|uniref:Uncharacterized protein n=1 Tax=Bacillus cereus TaxID=1396 RepID=A0A164NWR0_BACCE|nr:hypothetical protein [Bacillus cereus]KZD65943.1 hypothetical protein B4088_2700 [Bacillus cereus]
MSAAFERLFSKKVAEEVQKEVRKEARDLLKILIQNNSLNFESEKFITQKYDFTQKDLQTLKDEVQKER